MVTRVDLDKVVPFLRQIENEALERAAILTNKWEEKEFPDCSTLARKIREMKHKKQPENPIADLGLCTRCNGMKVINIAENNPMPCPDCNDTEGADAKE